MKLSGIYEVLRQGCESWGEQVVTGVVCDLNTSRAQHVYFTLGDGDDVLRCMVYRGVMRKTRAHINEGDTVTVVGRFEVYSRKGVLQLNVLRITAITPKESTP